MHSKLFLEKDSIQKKNPVPSIQEYTEGILYVHKALTAIQFTFLLAFNKVYIPVSILATRY